jgi:ribonucleoside-diphosphate reductase alpha chain
MRYFIDTEEKIRYLVNEGYYEAEFLKQYEMAFIEQLYEKAYAYKFRFPSFMSASKFYESYAMKSRNGEEILEKYEDRIVITALYLAQGNEELAEQAVDAMMTAYQPATPTALNSGKKARGELVSCFKLTMDDSMNSMAENIG